MAQMSARAGYVLSKLSFVLLLAVITIAPMPYGSVEAHWVALWCILLSVALATVDLSALRLAHIQLLAPVFALVVFLGVVVVLQSTSGLAHVLRDPIWDEAASLLGVSAGAHSAAASEGTPWHSLGPALAITSCFLVSFALALDPARADIIFKSVAYSGVVYAGYGLITMLSDPTHPDRLTGTFVNRNSAATYFGTCAIIWLALFLSAVRRDLSRLTKPVLFLTPSVQTFIAGIAFVVVLISVFLTLSRAGAILTIVSLALTGGVLLKRQYPRAASSALIATGVILASLAVLELLGGRVGLRISQAGLIDENRWHVYRASLAIVTEHPWIGTGLGTFPEVFPAYRPPELASPLVWDRAHSSLVELAIEMGVPFTGAVIALWIYLLVWLVRGCYARQRGIRFPAAGLGVFLLGSLHSLVDFSLQIPGYAIVFAAVTGCGLAQSKRPVANSSRSRAYDRLDNPASAASG